MKNIFSWAWIQSLAAKQKAVIREVGILKEDESAWNPLVTNYNVHIYYGWSILSLVRIFNNPNIKHAKKCEGFFFFIMQTP